MRRMPLDRRTWIYRCWTWFCLLLEPVSAGTRSFIVSTPAQEEDDSPTDRLALAATFDPRTLAAPELVTVAEPPLTGDNFMVGQLVMQTPDARRPPFPSKDGFAHESVVRMVKKFFELKPDGFSRPFLNNRQQDSWRVTTAAIGSCDTGGCCSNFNEVINASRRQRRVSLPDLNELHYLSSKYFVTRLTFYHGHEQSDLFDDR